MVDFGEETREPFEDSELAPPTTSNVGYYGSHQTSRLSWRHNGQVLDQTPRQNNLESRENYAHIKNDPENLSRFCDTVNPLPSNGNGASQLLQEITRVAETFEPCNASSVLSSNYRSCNVVPEVSPNSEVDYTFSETSQWVWARNASDERNFVGSTSSSMMVETSIGTVQYPASSQLVADSFSSTFQPVPVSEAQTSIQTSALMLQRAQEPGVSVSSSALDLSSALPIQTSALPPSQTSNIPVVSIPSSHQLLPSQDHLGSFDIGSRGHELSYHQNLQSSASLASPDEEDEENPDDVLAYPPELQCDHCGVTFSHVQHLKQHVDRCNYTQVLPDSTEHNVDENLSSHVMEENKRPQRHQAGQRSFSCKQCDNSISLPEKEKVPEKPFHCNECSITCNTKTMLARHKKIHTGEKPYSCGECKTSFTESGSLKVHMRQHTGDRPYKCSFCNEAFSGAGMLASHKRKHTGEKPYLCMYCGASFRLLSTLKSHRRRHTGEKPFSCELCGNSFTQKAALRRHKKTHLNIKPYECDQCGFKFRERENLRRHLLLHKISWPFVCSICGAGYNNVQKLETHKMLHNGGDKPYKCSKCFSSFASPKYLTQHKKRVHDRKGSVRCEECNATFNRKETLRSHSRIHKGSHQYICEQCGAAFNQRATLTRHTRIHLGVAVVDGSKPKENYNCRLCKKVFSTTTSLDRHVVESHMVEDLSYECPTQAIEANFAEEFSFRCPTCHLGFIDQCELEKHTSTHHQTLRPISEANEDHGEQIKHKYICEDCDQTFLRKWQLRAHRKYCLCKDLDSVDGESEEVKPNITLQNNTKEINAMNLVSAVLAAAGSNEDSEVSYEAPPTSEPPPVSVPLTVVSTSSSQQSEHCVSSQVSLSHTGVYGHVNEISQVLYQQSTQDIPQHCAKVNVMQPVHGTIGHNSIQNNVLHIDRQSHMQRETQEALSQQPLQESIQHHSFDFGVPQTEFYKSIPPLQSTQHHHNQNYDHPNTSHGSSLHHGSVIHNNNQDITSCEDLHENIRQSGSFLGSHKEAVLDVAHHLREQHRLNHFEDKNNTQESGTFLTHSDSSYLDSFQDQVHSYSQCRLSKSEDKFENRDELQPYDLQDQISKVRKLCPKLLGLNSNFRNKY